MRIGLYGAILTVLGALCSGSRCAGQVLWYNGDSNGSSALLNTRNSTLQDARIYDDFIIPIGQTWNVTAVFSCNFADFEAVAYDYEIRTNVMFAQADPPIHAGSDLAGQMSLTGRSFSGIAEFRYEVPVNLVLGPGTYWLMVRPVGKGVGFSYAGSTSGANAIGTPPGNDDNSFWDSTSMGVSFRPAHNYVGFVDYSMGIMGTVQGTGDPDPPAVPEPTAPAMLAAMTSGLVIVFSGRQQPGATARPSRFRSHSSR